MKLEMKQKAPERKAWTKHNKTRILLILHEWLNADEYGAKKEILEKYQIGYSHVRYWLNKYHRE